MEIIIVDKDDNEIGVKPIDSVDWEHDCYRVGAVLLRNNKNEILIAQRAFDKPHSPGAWGPSAAGMVESHETYKSNAIQETLEEIGHTLTEHEIDAGPKIYTERLDPIRKYFIQWYFADCEKSEEDFTLQTEEVAAVQWISKKELTKALDAHPEQYIDFSLEILNHIQ